MSRHCMEDSRLFGPKMWGLGLFFCVPLINIFWSPFFLGGFLLVISPCHCGDLIYLALGRKME